MAVDTFLCVLFGKMWKKWENGPFFRRRTTVRLGKYCTDGYCWIAVYKDKASVYQIREHYINSLTDKRSEWASYSTFVYIRISRFIQEHGPEIPTTFSWTSQFCKQKRPKKTPSMHADVRCFRYMCSIFSPPPPPHTHTHYTGPSCVYVLQH